MVLGLGGEAVRAPDFQTAIKRPGGRQRQDQADEQPPQQQLAPGLALELSGLRICFGLHHVACKVFCAILGALWKT